LRQGNDALLLQSGHWGRCLEEHLDWQLTMLVGEAGKGVS